MGRLRVDGRIVLSAPDAGTFERALEVPALLGAVGERLSDRVAWLVPERLAAAVQGLDDGGRPLALGLGLRIEPRRPERAAILEGGGAELLWVLLGAIARVDPQLLAGLEGAAGLQASLELVLPAAAREQLDRRAATLAQQCADRQQRSTGQRRPRDPMV